MIHPVEETPARSRDAPPSHEQGIAAGLKCLALAMISSLHSSNLGDRRAVAVAALSHKTAEEEYEEQVRILIRIVSASTLGLLAFAAGLLTYVAVSLATPPAKLRGLDIQVAQDVDDALADPDRFEREAAKVSAPAT